MSVTARFRISTLYGFLSMVRFREITRQRSRFPRIDKTAMTPKIDFIMAACSVEVTVWFFPRQREIFQLGAAVKLLVILVVQIFLDMVRVARSEADNKHATLSQRGFIDAS